MTARRALLASLPVGAAGAAATLLQDQQLAPTIRSAPGTDWPVPQQFGAVGDGRADDTAALTAWLEAAQRRNARLAAGTYRTTRSLVAQIGEDGQGLNIIGDGAANTAIIMDGPVSDPVLRIVGNMPDFDQLRISGFRLERPDCGMSGFGQGAGLLLENVRQFAIDDLRTFRQGIGLHLIGCLVGQINNVLSYYDRQGMLLEQGSYLSTPNVIAIDNCSILASLRIGIEINAGTCISMRGTTFEGTGVEAPDKPATGLLVRRSGLAGGVAIDASALYFENNHGSDIVIEHPDRPLTYGFTRCVINRFAKSALGPSIVFRSDTGVAGAPAIVDLSGSAFLGHGSDYKATAKRPAVAFELPNGFTAVQLFDQSTLYQFSEERPNLTKVRAPAR